MFEVVFLGTGGSSPFNNGQRLRRGTNTPCTVVYAGSNIIVFDAGTGICGLKSPANQTSTYHLFLSHYHVDHIQGLPFWDAIFNPREQILIYGQPSELGSVRDTIGHFLRAPFYPTGLGVAQTNLNFVDIQANCEILLDEDVKIRTISLSHPGGCLGYRVDYEGRSVCYLTDVELGNHRDDEHLSNFVANTDLLILDAAFKDGRCVPGWGHSSPFECADLANRSGAKRLALFHYNFSYTDEDIKKLKKYAKIEFENSFTPIDGLTVKI